MKPISKVQEAALASIESFIAERGYSPTLRELAKKLGYKSSSTVHGVLNRLEAAGYISREAAGARTIRLVKDSRSGIDDIVEYCSSLERYDTEDFSPPICIDELTIEQIAEVEGWIADMLRSCSRMTIDMYLDK